MSKQKKKKNKVSLRKVGAHSGPVVEAELLAKDEMDPDKWEVKSISSSLSTHIGYIKEDEEAENVSAEITNHSVRAEYVKRKATPKAPKPAKLSDSINVAFPATLTILKPYKTIAVMPDQQIGYRLIESIAESGSVEFKTDPIHSEQAMATALNIAAAQENLSHIVNLGDMLDLTQMTSFLGDSTFQNTLSMSLRRTTRELELQAEIVSKKNGGAKLSRHDNNSYGVTYIFGNHEYRVNKEIAKRWPEIQTLVAQGGNAPVMSLQNLLGLDEIGVHHEDYRTGGLYGWIFPGTQSLKFVHGDTVNSKGSTAANYLAKSTDYSIMFGHVHGIELHWATKQTRGDSVEIFACSPGTLARVDGAVPGYSTGVSSDGAGYDAFVDWQQGMALVHYRPGEAFSEELEIVKIREDGSAFYNGKIYKG